MDSKSRALLLAARDGSVDARAALLELHQNRLIGYFRARCLPDAWLAESLKNVFIRALASAEPPASEQSIQSWLRDFAAFELLRCAKKKQLPGGEPWAALCEAFNRYGDLRAAERRHAALAAKVPTALAKLNEGDREALQMVYRDRHDRATLAEKLRRSEVAVAALVDRARASLFHHLSGAEGRADEDA